MFLTGHKGRHYHPILHPCGIAKQNLAMA